MQQPGNSVTDEPTHSAVGFVLEEDEKERCSQSEPGRKRGIRFSQEITCIANLKKGNLEVHHSPQTSTRRLSERKPSLPSGDLAFQDVRGILRSKNSIVHRLSQEYSIHTFAKLNQNRDALESKLGKGCFLRKRTRHGKLTKRWFTLSEDGFDLLWSKNKPQKGARGSIVRAMTGKKKMELANVEALIYGSPGYPTEIPWLCFTLQFHNDRALHLVCETEEMVDQWFLGLQSLVPLSKFNISRGLQLWYRLRWKLQIRAIRSKLDWDPAFLKDALLELLSKETVTDENSSPKPSNGNPGQLASHKEENEEE